MNMTQELQGCTVKAKVNVNPMEAAQKIYAADLSLIVERIKKEGHIPADKIGEAVTEYRKFMALIAYSGGGSIGMCSKAVDEVWHAHILHMRHYEKFCKDVFGRQIYHAPVNSASPSDPASVARFIELYETVFGDIPAIWGITASTCNVNEPVCEKDCTHDCTSDCKGNDCINQ